MNASPSAQNTSLLARLLSRAALIKPNEISTVVAAFLLFFCMWGGYFAVRPVRETIGTLIGRDKTADLWIVTSIVSILIIPIYGALVARIRRSVFLPCVYGAVAVVLAVMGSIMQYETVGDLSGKFFYVFISVVNLLLISIFWSFLLEIFSGDQAKRLFGLIAAGGSAGALVGPFISDMSVKSIGTGGILFVGAGFFAAAIVCQRILLKVWASNPQQGVADDRPIGGNLFAGVTLILRSPYLLGIALFVVLISAVNTLLYFEQLRLVEIAYADTNDRTRVFARLDWVVQALTVLSQVFLTGKIASRFGVKALLSLVPLMMVFGFLALAMNGTLAVLAVVFVLRRSCEYAFVRPGREMLWSPLDKETKYKAKSTIDVPVYRGADALSAWINKLVAGAGFTPAAVAVMGAMVAAVWGFVGWRLGRKLAETAGANDKVPTAHH